MGETADIEDKRRELVWWLHQQECRRVARSIETLFDIWDRYRPAVGVRPARDQRGQDE